MRRRAPLAIAILLLPLMLAVAAGLLGIEVSSRDDSNYLAELADRPAFAATLDAVSWMMLSFGTQVSGLTSAGLRFVGLVIAAATVLVLTRRKGGLAMVALFAVSVLPLYVTIYFSQLRLAIALLTFAWMVTSERMRNLAVPMSALAHSSFLIVLFPPLALLIPFGLGLASQLDPDSVAAVKLLSYLQSDLADMPWYFGWELVGIALVVGWHKKWRWMLEIVAVAVAARLIGTELSLDIGRRILEIGILAYSPFFLWAQRRQRPLAGLIPYFVALGIMQTAMSLYSGVVEF